jgi:hypothetical protein
VEELLRRTGLEVEVSPARPVPLLKESVTELDRRARLALELLSPPSLRASEPDEEARTAAWAALAEPWMQHARAHSRMEAERLGHFADPGAPASAFTGRVPEAGAVLAFGPERPLSAAALQRSANCAYQGFLADVLGLEGAEARGEDLDAASRGNLWHAVLEALFPVLADKGLLGRSADQVPGDVLDGAVEVAVAKVIERGHVGHPELWRLAQQRARAMALRLLASPHGGLPFDGLTPTAFELAFGVEDAPGALRHVVLPAAAPGEAPIHFRGGIDRVDAGPGRVAVVDYKSGSVERRAEDLLATEFQLPLYLYAARQAHPGASLEAAWLGLKDGKALHLDQVAGGALPDGFFSTDAEGRAAAREAGTLNFANAVHERVGAMRRGEFPVHPKECGHCRFRPVCRFRSDDAGEEGAP